MILMYKLIWVVSMRKFLIGLMYSKSINLVLLNVNWQVHLVGKWAGNIGIWNGLFKTLNVFEQWVIKKVNLLNVLEAARKIIFSN